jgi:hypothetical protein
MSYHIYRRLCCGNCLKSGAKPSTIKGRIWCCRHSEWQEVWDHHHCWEGRWSTPDGETIGLLDVYLDIDLDRAYYKQEVSSYFYKKYRGKVSHLHSRNRDDFDSMAYKRAMEQAEEDAKKEAIQFCGRWLIED